MEVSPDLIKGVEKICTYIGETETDFQNLILEEGLPSWRRGDSGIWRALKSRLDMWLEDQTDKHKKTMVESQN